jgi:predicted HD phosphohydrolase
VIKVTGGHITLGQPLHYSVYNNGGELLLKKGHIITTKHPRKIILIPGPPDANELNPNSVTSYNPENIFKLKTLWLSELYALLISRKKVTIHHFSHRILSLFLQVQLQVEHQQDAVLGALKIDFENDYGLNHALHCAVISKMIAKRIGLNQIERLVIVAAALSHDIGIIVEQEVYHQQTQPLSEQQQNEIKQHPLLSETRLRKLGVDNERRLDIAKHHHERLDGSGYPDQLTGEHISVPARALAIADIYCAIVHPTLFRPENSGEHAVVVAHGSHSQIPLVSALISPQGTLYLRPKPGVFAQQDNHIIKEESLSKYNMLLEPIEKLWIKR